MPLDTYKPNYFSIPDADDARALTERRFNGATDILTEDRLLEGFGREYLIDGLLAHGEMVVAWGPPKCGKTAYWLRAARRLTQALPVFGRPVTTARSAIYLATEGGFGLGDRVRALQAIDGPAPDFRVITARINLLDKRDLRELIDYTEDDHLLVIDTLGRALGTSGADENGPDMSRLIANLDILRSESGIATVLLHHGTKAGVGGPRGHSSLGGAVDSGIEHARRPDGSATATVKFARDNEPGLTMHYGLRPIALPASQYDRARTAVIAADLEAKLDRYAEIALLRLREAAAGGGRVSIETWRRDFKSGLPDLTDANLRQQFRRARLKLEKDGTVKTDTKEAWFVTG